jgi:PAS domain S-box-containing protein
LTAILLRVLLVEDSEDDALLTLLELRKGGFRTESERVETRSGMERALAGRTWDLVICDHVMPGFSSAGALDVMRKRALDLPFIIVSGVAPEDLVTAAMRQGAHDFISKGNLVRLVPAVQRELREAALRQDRRRIESRLEESEARNEMLAAAVEQVAEAIAISGPSGVVSYANRSFEALTGFQAAQIQGCALGELLGHPDVARAVAQAAQGSSWEGRISLSMDGTRPQEVDATFSPVRDPGHSVQNLVAVLRDVTKEVELERQLRQAQKMDALGVLAAGIAHDFNNVLTTILASAELIKCKIEPDSPITPKVDAILHAGLCAAGLTKQILGFSRKADEKRLPLDLTAIVRDGLHTLHSSIPANVELREELMSGVWVEADPSLIHQVVLNLAINAIQAMQPAGGTLLVSLSEEVEEARIKGLAVSRWAVLTVRDSGCGMDEAVQERIFEPFFSTKPAGEGTGLGLAMVHATVTKAGGRIAVQSAPGQGTTFQIHLPTAEVREMPLGEALPEDAGGTESILFLDDDRMTATVARLGLQKLGYRVASFTRPEDALAAFGQQPDGFDLAFLDLSRDGADGMDLAQRLQELRPDLPMILVTGQASAGALPASVHASFQGIVARPFTALDLANALRKALQARPRPEAEPKPAASGYKPLILLAEDSRTTRGLIRSGLERGGYAVQEARDGLEAWELFTQAPHGRRFDLLLTDVVMPRMDGLELVQLVRKADPALPIGVLTSNEDSETLKSAMHLGVNEFLNKPFELADLLACVQSLLAERSSRLDARRSQETARAVRQAQRSMVAAPEKGVPLFTLYEPLSDAGGDVFRCFRCADGSILFILADVAGHSVLSSYAVASFLGMLSSYVGESYGLMALAPNNDAFEAELPCSQHGCGWFGHVPCDPLPHLASKLNHGIQSGPFSEVPVCTLLGLWTPATGRLQLLNAGIPHGMHYRRAQDQVVPVALNGTPLGVFPEADMEGAVLQLEPGDRLLFGTDGFFEVAAPGKGTFQDLVPGHWQASATAPLDASLSVICEAARSHGGGMIIDDLLVVGFEQPALDQELEQMVLQLPSTPRAIDLACDRLSECLKARRRGWATTPKRRFDIVIAVREALSNAVYHGNGNRPGASVKLTCRPQPEQGQLVVSVADDGPGFDLEAQQPPMDPLSERGRGLALIRAHAKDVHMTGNALTMTFDLEESSHADQ